jgi:REP-associated tyrosine transposase
MCTHLRRPLFGEIFGGAMHLNEAGRVVEEIWNRMFSLSEDCHTWIVMPNHLHGIVAITDSADSGTASQRQPLGRLVAAFKATSKKRVNQIRRTPGLEVWQRNFYEHIIATDRSFERILSYIHENPMRWEDDPENTKRTKAVQDSTGRRKDGPYRF